MAMDGVVLSLPPTGDVDRENYCHVGETHIYRKVGEGGKPERGGGDSYGKQIPYARAVPMWTHGIQRTASDNQLPVCTGTPRCKSTFLYHTATVPSCAAARVCFLLHF